ncbi:C1 family peptidase [Porphyromonadaceae bacterium]
MKKIYLLLAVFCFSMVLQAQKDTAYVFTTVKENKITPVKNQNRTGTCWSFSGIGFVESELLRMGKGEFDISEMFVVSHCYTDKAVKYVRMHGNTNYSQGGSFHDVLHVIKNYGMVPEEVMPGLNYGQDMHVHGELESSCIAFAKNIITNPNRELSTAWLSALNGIVDAYLGERPAKFTYKGKEYTPKSFAASTGFNPDDYVSVTSYTHHPFGTQFALEIPDNWIWGLSNNVPIDDMMAMIDRSIMNGYTVAWGSDVSERSFSRDLATIPDVEAKENSGSDEDRWTGLSKREKEDMVFKQKGPVVEKVITQELRQKEFDNYKTTDDHGMLIYGIAKDQTGKKFYMVKNSWGAEGKYKGMFYASEAFVKLKTMNIVIHKDNFKK